MSARTRAKSYERMSQARLNSFIIDSKENDTEKIVEDKIESRPVLCGHAEYDTLKPESKISKFCADVREMISQYEYDKERLVELDNQVQDILHYIELTENKNANAGYKLYKQLTEVRRERRRCKNEIDLLQPVYDAFHNTDILNRLSEVQGRCRNAKQFIDGRGYSIRTDVLNDFM